MTLPTELRRACRQRQLLVLWAALPFTLAAQPPPNRPLALNRVQSCLAGLAGPPRDLVRLPPLPVLSLDPTPRLEQSFQAADLALQPVHSRRDVPVRDGHSLLKLAGDLAARRGVILSRAEIRELHRDPDKEYLLAEARRRLAGRGVLLILGADPRNEDWQAWWSVLSPALGRPAAFAVGEPPAGWPAGVTWLDSDLETLSVALRAIAPEPEPAEPEMAETVRIFISSTWKDLQPEREAVEKALHRMEAAEFSGMEYFGSRPETPREASLAEVDRSDIYVGLFAHRYGSGLTEAEYRRARQRELPCLIYLKEENVPVVPAHYEADPAKVSKLAALKQELSTAHIVSFFTSPDQLATQVIADLHNFFSRGKPSPTPAAAGSKYNLTIDRARGVVIGDGTTVSQLFGQAGAPPAQAGPAQSQTSQRCADLIENIQETLSLLKLYEEQRRLAADPKEKRRAEREIADLREQLSASQAEARELGCE